MSYRALDLCRLLPGPLAGRMLADLGFETLRLLPPAGDMTETLSPQLYDWLNAGKQMETVDLKTPEGVKRLKSLASEAAILLETNRPGVMERLGVGPDDLRAINPKLTYVRVASYRDEAFREAPGHDLTYLASGGFIPRFGDGWKHLQIADGAGAYWAVIAALDGLRKGGGFYEVYLSEAAAALAYPLPVKLDGSIVCYGIYPARDGYLALGLLEPHLWQRFCVAVGREDWKGSAFSPAIESNPVYTEIKALLAERSADEWEQLALKHGFPARKTQPYAVPATTIPWRETR
ncbi:MAG: CoA transferase [Chloracidobacterium sp. CP2_5A]|nr:MAG: CoA transferase [Chloracidobacterium sp. CP2_5A]